MGTFQFTTHSGPFGFFQRVPLVFSGPGLIRARGHVSPRREITTADVAPTLARLLRTRFPAKRAGDPIREVLLPDRARGRPRVIVTVVWDGAGWNVLDRWPDSWPHLRSLIRRGTSVRNGIVGSSPSVTPAIHATLGTGTFPRRHGQVNLPQRRGRRIVDPTRGGRTDLLEVTTLGDIFDRRVGNRSRVGMLASHWYPMGMLGHGASLKGADRDLAVITHGSPGKLGRAPRAFRVPRRVARVAGYRRDFAAADLVDGKRDGRWLGHPVGDRHSPAALLYQARQVKRTLTVGRFGTDNVPDLLYVNFKQTDTVGHRYNLGSREMKVMVSFADRALGRIVAYLRSRVPGRWVVFVTADHGSGPSAESTGGWPIARGEVVRDVERRFGEGRLVMDDKPVGFWIRRSVAAGKRISTGEISNFLVDYRIRDNAPSGEPLPGGYRTRGSERVYLAAFPSNKIDAVWRCATRR